MGNYVCTGCGETCYSKNPAIRSVFPSDQVASIMTNIVNVTTEVRKDGQPGIEGKRVVTFEFPYSDTDDTWSDAQLEAQCLKNVSTLTEDQVKHWLCDHRWDLVSGNELQA